MSSFLLLLICLGLGVLFARSGRLPRDAPAVINTWIIDLALPALVMELLPKLDFRLDVWYLALSPWLVFIGSWLLFDRIGRRLHWSRGHWRRGADLRARQYRLHGLSADRSPARA